MTQNLLNTPWKLFFDRDGTEDFGIICDALGNDIAASHLPSTRIGERTFETGTFWLPESDEEEPPVLVRQLQVMTGSPQLLCAPCEGIWNPRVEIPTGDPRPSRKHWGRSRR